MYILCMYIFLNGELEWMYSIYITDGCYVNQVCCYELSTSLGSSCMIVLENGVFSLSALGIKPMIDWFPARF